MKIKVTNEKGEIRFIEGEDEMRKIFHKIVETKISAEAFWAGIPILRDGLKFEVHE